MAEKTVGELQYKIEVVGGDKFESNIKKAESSMKNLGDSAGKAEKPIADLGNSLNNLGDPANNQSKLKDIDVKIKELTQSFKSGNISIVDYKKGLDELSKEKQTLTKFENLSKAQKKLVQDLEKGKISAEEFNSKLKNIGNKSFLGQLNAVRLGVLSIYGAVTGFLLGAFADVIKSGAELSQLEQSFDDLAGKIGTSGDALLATLQKTSQGTISNKDLILASNRAIVLGVAKDTQDLNDLLNISRALGRDLGLSTQQAFNDLVTGLGRGSAMILDNLGIIVKADEAQEKYAKSIGKTKEQLTAAEQKQAIINEALKKGRERLAEIGDFQLSYAEKFEAMKAQTQNFKDAVGKGFLIGIQGMMNSLFGLGDTVGVVGTEFDGLSKAIYKVGQVLSLIAKVTIQPIILGLQSLMVVLKGAGGVAIGFGKDVINSFKSAAQGAKGVGEGIAEIFKGNFKEGAAKIKDGFKDIRFEASESKKAFDEYGKATDALGAKSEKYVKSLASTTVNIFSDKSYEEMKKAVEAGQKMEKTQKELENQNNKTAESTKKNSEKTNELAEKLIDVRDRAVEAGDALEKKYGESLKKFGEDSKKNIEETTQKLAEIALNAEKKKAELQAEIAKGGDNLESQQKELAEVQKILDARVGYEQRAQDRINEIKKKATEAGIDPATLGLDGLLKQNDLEAQIAEQRRVASLDEFTRFEEEQAKKLTKLAEDAIAELVIMKNKIDTQKKYEDELTQFVLSSNAKKAKSVAQFANEAIAKYGEMAESLKTVISLQDRIGNIRTGSVPQFHDGGYVGAQGGEVHAGEFVIPAELVRSMPNLVSQLDSMRNNPNQVNNININAGQGTSADYSAVARELAWRLNRL